MIYVLLLIVRYAIPIVLMIISIRTVSHVGKKTQEASDRTASIVSADHKIHEITQFDSIIKTINEYEIRLLDTYERLAKEYFSPKRITDRINHIADNVLRAYLGYVDWACRLYIDDTSNAYYTEPFRQIFPNIIINIFETKDEHFQAELKQENKYPSLDKVFKSMRNGEIPHELKE